MGLSWSILHVRRFCSRGIASLVACARYPHVAQILAREVAGVFAFQQGAKSADQNPASAQKHEGWLIMSQPLQSYAGTATKAVRAKFDNPLHFPLT